MNYLDILIPLSILVALNLGLYISHILPLFWNIFANTLYATIIISYLTLKYSNLTNFTFFSVIMGLILGLMIFFGLDIKKFQKTYLETHFIYWFMLVISLLTLVGIVKSFNYYIKIITIGAPLGDQGVQGDIGKRGSTLDSDLNMCENQSNEMVEKLIRNYKDSNQIPYDKKVIQFKNLYMKRQLKRICRSGHYSNLKSQYGSHYGPVTELNNGLKRVIKHLLSYKYGLRFLEDSFYVKNHWNYELLSKNEKVSPFSVIEQTDVWKWN